MNIVFVSYLKAFVIICTTVFLGWLAAKVLISKFSFLITPALELALVVVGTILLLTAGIGKLGWHIQTWGGQTPAESINDWLFFLLTIVGAWLLFTEIFIKYIK